MAAAAAGSRVNAAMRRCGSCSECSAPLPKAGRHAVPNLGVFVCNRCYGIFREGMHEEDDEEERERVMMMSTVMMMMMR